MNIIIQYFRHIRFDQNYKNKQKNASSSVQEATGRSQHRVHCYRVLLVLCKGMLNCRFSCTNKKKVR